MATVLFGGSVELIRPCAIPIKNLLGFGDRSKHNQSRTKVKRKRHTRLFTRCSPHSEKPLYSPDRRFPEIH
ncbi:hypothetical protein YC2023_081045 [Brassica napus]